MYDFTVVAMITNPLIYLSNSEYILSQFIETLHLTFAPYRGNFYRTMRETREELRAASFVVVAQAGAA